MPLFFPILDAGSTIPPPPWVFLNKCSYPFLSLMHWGIFEEIPLSFDILDAGSESPPMGIFEEILTT